VTTFVHHRALAESLILSIKLELLGFRKVLAEGEELGSNLLQVLHRRPTELGGLGWVAGALPAPSLRIEGRETAILPRRRPLAAKIRASCATTSKLWPLPRSADRRPLAQLKGGS